MPITAAQITSGAEIAGGIFQAVGQISEGQSIADAQNFNASIAQQEIEISKASRALERVREKKNISKTIGTQIALFAKAGVTLAGSPLDTIQQTAENLELDILIKDINAEIQQSRLQSEIAQRKAKAEAAKRESVTRAGTTLLSLAPTVGKLFATKPKKATKTEKE